jgi:site-specific DNA recombinase
VLAAALATPRRDAVESTGSDDSGNASYSRFSSDLQTDRSISDQQRKCRDGAARQGLIISPALEFKDEAVSGAKHVREGFDGMLRAARNGQIQTLTIEGLSRLARDSVLTMQTLRELVYVHKIRFISIDDGIDTSRGDSWELVAAIMGVQNEQYLKVLSKNVFRGQEGVVLDGLCVGDYCFGFSSIPVPGSEAQSKGRNKNPKMTYVINLSETEWVALIFFWFVHEGRKLRWIARELNRRGAPKDHRSSTPNWTSANVSSVLKNRKYIGIWPWGNRVNVRDPMTGKTHQEERPSEDTERWLRHFPELRLIDDETFSKAQQLLAQLRDAHAGNRDDQGWLLGSSERSSKSHPRHLLAGLIECQHCGRRLYVGGPNGKYLICRGYAMGVCPCMTQLRRDLAEELILRAIGDRILSNAERVTLALQGVRAEWDRLQRELPNQRKTADVALADVERRIARLVDQCEEQEVPELAARLKERRAERDALQTELRRLQEDGQRLAEPPTAAWVEKGLADLRGVLQVGGPAAAHALRDLVGGTIVVTEIRHPGRKRHYLRGRLVMRLRALSTTLRASGNDVGGLEDGPEEVVEIDFRRIQRYEELAEPAKVLWDLGLENEEIGQQLGCGRALVTRALDHWYLQRGETPPDGRSCRKRLKGRRKAETLQAQIMELWHADVLVQDIAKQLDCCMEIVHEAVTAWHQECGLPVPDGRARRREIRLRNNRQSA